MRRLKTTLQISILIILLSGCQKCNDRASNILRNEDIQRTERWRKILREDGVFNAPIPQPKKGKEVKDV